MTTTGRRYAPLLLGGAATLLLLVGLGGLGDAPSPQGTAERMVTHFTERRTDVLASAPFGYAGAAALLAFAAYVARRLWAAGERGAAAAVAIGAAVEAGYHVAIHVLFTTIVYEVAAESPDTTKGLFVMTILAVPVLGAGVAVLLGGFALGARSTGIAPLWLVGVSAVGAVFAAVAVASFATRGFFSPDVQQLVAGTVGMFWPLLAGAALARSRGRASWNAVT